MHEDKKSVLEEAIDKVCGDRHDDYGDATLNHTRIAALWNVWITNRRWAGQPLTAYDVAMMMNLTKFARCMHKPKQDSHVDIAGYAAVTNEIYETIVGVKINGGTEEPTKENA